MPGTYWFHPARRHAARPRALRRAVVEASDEPLDYDREVVLVLDDWLDGIAGTPDAKLKSLLAHGMQMPGMDMSGRRRHVRTWT